MGGKTDNAVDLLQFVEQFIGWRAGRAALGGKQFDNNGTAFCCLGLRRPKQARNQRDNKHRGDTVPQEFF